MSKDINIVSRGTKQIGQRLLPWIFPIVLLVVWQIASSSGTFRKSYSAGSYGCCFCFWHLLISGELWQHVKVSAGRTYSGYLLVVV